MKIICDNCHSGPCHAESKKLGFNNYNSKRCYFKGEFIANWQQTDEYEIIKKPTPPKSEEELQERLKNNQEIPSIPEHIAKMTFSQTPNCSICEWKEKKFKSDIKDFEALNEALNNYTCCSAQAFRSVDKCYNSENCKSLFKPKIEIQPTESKPKRRKSGDQDASETN